MIRRATSRSLLVAAIAAQLFGVLSPGLAAAGAVEVRADARGSWAPSVASVHSVQSAASAPSVASPSAAGAPPFVGRTAATTPPELQIVSAARYDVQPDRARVHVTLDTTITNTHHDTGTTRTYYDTAYLVVLPEAANFAVSSAGVAPTVSVRSATSAYTILTIGLGRRLLAGRHAALRLQFDLPDSNGTALSDVRVGTSLVAFPVWAFATDATPGSSVTVAFPPGYNIQQQAGSLPNPTAASDGRTIFTSGPLAQPLAFYAYFVADQPGAFATTRLSATVGATTVPIAVKSWTDDPAWGARVAAVVQRGLPALQQAIGLPFTGTGLVVQESVSRTIGGYAGIFDPVASTIQVAYYADPFVVLHETAHAWFNGQLASDRWILEGFASWYAAQAAAALHITADAPELTPNLRSAAIPLNEWPGLGRADTATEDFGYAATFLLAGSIAARAGAAGLREVWQAAAAGEDAYQPFHAGAAVERGAGAPDWRGLLDLLEERTGKSYLDLWRHWVVRPSELALLDQRATARTAYAATVVAAGDWELPPAVRKAMSAWQFDQAAALMVASRAVLAQRTQIAAAAKEAGLTPPDTLRTAFEGADGPSAAAAEADGELAALASITDAVTASEHVDGVFAQMGLLGLRPEDGVVAARAAFEAGNTSAAESDAASAQAVWQTAEGRGVQRLISVLAVVAGSLVLFAALAFLFGRRRRRERPERWS